MTIDFSSTSLTPFLPIDMTPSAMGGTQEERIKQVSKAMEGLFAGQLLAELGKGFGGPQEGQESGLYQDFIQQAMAQQVANGGGFGLAKMLESYLTPAKHDLATHTPGPNKHGNSHK
jgi:Rod binding domain-containing protein